MKVPWVGIVLGGVRFMHQRPKKTLDAAAGGSSFLETRFQLSREWFYDLNSHTAAELVGGGLEAGDDIGG